MKYKVTHTTTYVYESPVRICHNLVMLSPRHEGSVRVHSHNLRIVPKPPLLHARTDFFGNQLHAFSIEESHRQLKVTSISRLRVLSRRVPPAEETPAWDTIVHRLANAEDTRWLEASPFLFDSRRAQRSPVFEAYARQDFSPGRPILMCAIEFIGRIYREFRYDTTATFVNTMPQETFALKRGVCQDFAQIAISCLRSIGLPARYVSGYLRTIAPEGKERLIGADQSHAWISVYCGDMVGWIDLDPTNNCISSRDHVPISWGRDYQDVVPVRGVFLGGGKHTLKVNVEVAPLAT